MTLLHTLLLFYNILFSFNVKFCFYSIDIFWLRWVQLDVLWLDAARCLPCCAVWIGQIPFMSKKFIICCTDGYVTKKNKFPNPKKYYYTLCFQNLYLFIISFFTFFSFLLFFTFFYFFLGSTTFKNWCVAIVRCTVCRPQSACLGGAVFGEHDQRRAASVHDTAHSSREIWTTHWFGTKSIFTT